MADDSLSRGEFQKPVEQVLRLLVVPLASVGGGEFENERHIGRLAAEGLDQQGDRGMALIRGPGLVRKLGQCLDFELLARSAAVEGLPLSFFRSRRDMSVF